METPTFGKKMEVHEEPSVKEGSFHAELSRRYNPIKCRYYGKISHHEEEGQKKKNELASTRRQLANCAMLVGRLAKYTAQQVGRSQSRSRSSKSLVWKEVEEISIFCQVGKYNS